AWFVFFMIIEQLGETALAASNITRSIYMVLMIPVWGLSVSVNTLVSNTLGRGATQLVIPVIRRVLYIGLIINLFLVLFLWIFPQPLVAFYTDDPHLIEATLPLLRVVAFALIAFAIGMILFSGLSGTGKTLLALKLEVLSIMFYLVTALVLAVYFNASAPILWMVEVVYFSLMGLFAFIALKRGSWKDFSI
ncbi:MAG: MATE family efflux transporter, partial [Bacteroidales bacterium]